MLSSIYINVHCFHQYNVLLLQFLSLHGFFIDISKQFIFFIYFVHLLTIINHITRDPTLKGMQVFRYGNNSLILNIFSGHNLDIYTSLPQPHNLCSYRVPQPVCSSLHRPPQPRSSIIYSSLPRRRTSQPTNQLTNRLTNHLTNQSPNHITNQATNQATDQPLPTLPLQLAYRFNLGQSHDFQFNLSQFSRLAEQISFSWKILKPFLRLFLRLIIFWSSSSSTAFPSPSLNLFLLVLSVAYFSSVGMSVFFERFPFLLSTVSSSFFLTTHFHPASPILHLFTYCIFSLSLRLDVSPILSTSLPSLVNQRTWHQLLLILTGGWVMARLAIEMFSCVLVMLCFSLAGLGWVLCVAVVAEEDIWDDGVRKTWIKLG